MTTGAKKTDFYVVQLEKEAAKRAAARAMLAALKEIANQVSNLPRSPAADHIDEISHAAMAEAEAAGIKAEGRP